MAKKKASSKKPVTLGQITSAVERRKAAAKKAGKPMSRSQILKITNEMKATQKRQKAAAKKRK